MVKKKALQPIGMFDSGVGGLTVMQQIVKRLPHEQIVYFGDTARLPYGEKSQETIFRYSIENAIFLLQQNVKMVVVACNTAASACSETNFRQFFNVPVIDVVSSGVDSVAALTTHQRIAVLGTKGTINSGIYSHEILKRLPGAFVISVSCPLFVPLVEERFFNHEAARLIVKEYLAPLKSQNIDTILLGCTHYPLLSHLIQEEVGPNVAIVNSAIACAEKVASLLFSQNLAADLSDASSGNDHRFYVSEDPAKFTLLAEEFLGSPLANRAVLTNFVR